MSLALTSANASILLAVSLSGPKLRLTSLDDAMADRQRWLLGPLRPRTESARRKMGLVAFFDSNRKRRRRRRFGGSTQRFVFNGREVPFSGSRSTSLIEVPLNKIEDLANT